jgi:hypothetical protein
MPNRFVVGSAAPPMGAADGVDPGPLHLLGIAADLQRLAAAIGREGHPFIRGCTSAARGGHMKRFGRLCLVVGALTIAGGVAPGDGNQGELCRPGRDR